MFEIVETNSDPRGAGSYVRRHFWINNVTATEAARKMSVNQSTVTRLLNGGGLSIDMAARLHIFYGFKIDSLFLSESARNTYHAICKAEELMEGQK